MRTSPIPTTFLIADISGYTEYLAGVELDHAQDILADLIGAVVSALRPAFRLAKLEGDAAFTYQAADRLDGSMLLDTIERSYFGFRRRRRDVRQATSCACNACVRIPDLDLKFVVHHGEAIVQKVAGRQELLGSGVIVVHRLLKNDVVERLGVDAYALLSQAVMDAARLEPVPLGMHEHTETYEHIGEVRGWVHDLDRRWAEEEARTRVFITSEEAVLDISFTTSAPPQVAWAYLTAPGQRIQWQREVTSVEVTGTTGGRRGVGSENHCMHGQGVTIEEILDWRPYDYVTDLTILDTPAGLVRLPHTIEFEPTPTGTTIHFRYAPPKERRHRALAEELGRAAEQAIRAGIPLLIAQLEAEVAAVRDQAGGPEVELAVRDPDRAFGSLRPPSAGLGGAGGS